MNHRLVLACIMIHATSLLAQNHTINMLVHEYPQEELIKQSTPDYRSMPKQIIKNTFYQPVVSGVYGIYNGYLAHSNDLGILSFPRTTQIEQFTLIITPFVRPLFFENTFTIDHWLITQPELASAYHIQRHKDPETKLRYWKVLKTDIPANNYVPLHAIIIVAKPKNIYVPTGVSPTTNLPNLVLPPIYAKRGLDRVKNALFLFNIKQFFASVEKVYKVDQQTRSALVTS